jgi:uncharacterized membrane protein
MPYDWTKPLPEAPDHPGASSVSAEPLARLALWPHQSLSAPGFATFIGATALLLALPLLGVLGTGVGWVLMIFLLGGLAAIWIALRANARARMLHEDLSLWHDRIRLDHHRPGRVHLTWEDNPYWVRVRLQPTGGPVENYLTLKGTDREVELGAFLSPEERATLAADLQGALARLR